jgi:hypothetical protein
MFENQSKQRRDSSSQQNRKTKSIPKRPEEMNIQDKIENHKVIENMNKRIHFTKNPRY